MTASNRSTTSSSTTKPKSKRGPASRLARWDGSAWHPLGCGVEGALGPLEPNVIALYVDGGKLYVGGHFLRAGGRFCGHLFGDRDTWASQGVTCFTRSEVEALLSGLSVERLDEEEEDSQDARGTPKHWHLFHIVACRTLQSSPSQ